MLWCTKSSLNYYRRDLVPHALFLSSSIFIIEGTNSAGGTNPSLKYSRQDLMSPGTKSCLNYFGSNLMPQGTKSSQKYCRKHVVSNYTNETCTRMISCHYKRWDLHGFFKHNRGGLLSYV